MSKFIATIHQHIWRCSERQDSRLQPQKQSEVSNGGNAPSPRCKAKQKDEFLRCIQDP